MGKCHCVMCDLRRMLRREKVRRRKKKKKKREEKQEESIILYMWNAVVQPWTTWIWYSLQVSLIYLLEALTATAMDLMHIQQGKRKRKREAELRERE